MKQTGFNSYRKIFLPNPTWLVAFFGAAILTMFYLLAQQYSDRFIAEEGVALFQTAQTDTLARIVLFAPWVGWIDRALDFTFWGALAAVVIVLAWSFSATKTTIVNHKLVTKFENFNSDEKQWDQNFAVALGLRIALIFVGLYATGALVLKVVPSLSGALSVALSDHSIGSIFVVVFYTIVVWVTLVFIAACVKMFRHIEVA